MIVENASPSNYLLTLQFSVHPSTMTVDFRKQHTINMTPSFTIGEPIDNITDLSIYFYPPTKIGDMGSIYLQGSVFLPISLLSVI